MKLRKIVKVGATVQYEQSYLGGLEYRKNGTGSTRVEAVYHAEGRYLNLNAEVNNTLLWQKEYTLKDHLGNARITFTDKNANGIVDVPSDIVQENHYYPFGLNYEGGWRMNDAARDNKYQYNSKEWNDDFGLNWNDYGARWYDAAVGRFSTIDPLAEQFTFQTPYAYAANDPIKFIDENGENPILGAAVGAVAGGIVGFFSKKGTLRERLRNAGRKAVSGAVAGAIIGSGVGIAAFVGGGVLTSGSIIGTSGFLGGAASSVVDQAFEIGDGTREHLSEDETLSDALIGVPAAIVGGAIGSATGGVISQQASKETAKVFQRQAVREFQKHVKNTLKDQQFTKKEARAAAKAAVKLLQESKSKSIEAIRVKVTNGTATATEVVVGGVSDKVDDQTKN